MLPNSRIVPPPSSALPDPNPRNDLHRKRSTSQVAPPSHHHHHSSDLSSQSKPASKNLFSRFRATPPPPPQQKQPQYDPPPRQSGTPRPSASLTTPAPSTTSVPKYQTFPPNNTDQKVRRKPVEETRYASRPRHASMVASIDSQHYNPLMDAATPEDAIQKKSTQKGAIKGGFGRIFRKLSKATEDDDLMDDSPRVRPISIGVDGRIASRTPNPHNIPLAPAPPQPPKRNVPQDSPSISGIPTDYLVRPATARRPHTPPPPPPSTTTNPTPPPPLPQQPPWQQPHVTKKSYSIYSTFGPDHSSESAIDMIEEHSVQKKPSQQQPALNRSHSVNTASFPPPPSDNLAQIVAYNMQRKSQTTRVVPKEQPNEPVVVEANDVDSFNALDEYKRDSTCEPMGAIKEETTSSSSESDSDESNDEDDVFVDATGSSQDDIEREKGESKLSKRLSGGHFGSAGGLMLATAAAETASMPKAQKRRSRPPPEDIAQAMLNWKRHSGGANKRLSGISAIAKWASENPPSKQEEEDLPPPDKQTSRAEAAELLTGGGSRASSVKKDATKTTPTPNGENTPRPQHQRNRSLKMLSDDFSKSLDDAWHDPDPGIAQVLDPRKSPEPVIRTPSKDHTDKEAKEAAQHLWDEDDVIVPRERIAEWLGQGKPLNSDALIHYMENFEFSHMRLDSAFRKLCSKLYFKAEAQQIDRILEVFANRYWKCNPKTILKSADVVYAVVYSVLLLNTDLHVAQGNYNRMTRQEFIRNTMAAVHDQQSVSNEIEKGSPEFSKEWEVEVEAYLKDLYSSVKQYQILQPLTRKASMQEFPEKRGSILGGKRVVGLKRSVGSIIRRSGRESMLFPEEVQPRTSSSSGPRPSSPLPRSPRRESFSSIGSATSFASRARVSTLSPSFQPMINFMDAHGGALFTSKPPYIKEGVVMRKHLLENATQKARHREWKECFLVVTEGELKMYALQSSGDVERRTMLRASSASFANLADSLSKQNALTSASFGGTSHNKWASQSQLIGTIPLNHTLSNVLPPPGYNRQRPHVFAIQQPDGGVYLFQTASPDQVNEWVATCNYWAARQSKEPLPGGVSNMEYGWGACLFDVVMNLDTDQAEVHSYQRQDPDSIAIYDWLPPSSPLVASTLDEKQQHEALQKHLKALDDEINSHRELKPRMIAKFPSRTQNHVKALHNWEAKSKYLLHDIIKYQNYCDALEKSIQEQEKAKDAEEASEKQEINDSNEIHLDYHESNFDLTKEIGDQLRLVF
ncbi:hypothetical protein BJV82DRAFT_615215 [Fennellomyces sp. T-0311]|nr:hypothetical protein BJV82DRAFT_615215 [Fennellomyces sp. T-0311]